MKMKYYFAAIVALAGCAQAANAQTPWLVGPTVNYGGGDAASTPASAGGHAIADMIRAQGAYNAATAAAMVNVEEARGKFIENQKLWTELYLTKQRALEAQHARARGEARERNARYREMMAAHSSLPPRLDSSQFNQSTGQISWPSALLRDTFALQRVDLEKLFESRASDGVTSDVTAAIVTKVRELHNSLREHIREIEVQEYLQARRFLESLLAEGRFPAN